MAAVGGPATQDPVRGSVTAVASTPDQGCDGLLGIDSRFQTFWRNFKLLYHSGKFLFGSNQTGLFINLNPSY